MNNTASKVAKNSIWLIAQPLIMSVASLFVVGLVARKLGPNDYGVFVFAFAFTLMFRPMINLGLRALTIRTIAEDKSAAPEYLGQILVLRTLLGVLAIALVYVGLRVFNYSSDIFLFTLMASITLLLESIFTTFHDSFQAFERMRYVAISQMASGIFILSLTVVVMLMGFGLTELVMVYVLGNVVTIIMCFYYQWKHFELPKLGINLQLYGSQLKRGFAFFIPMILNTINGRLGILLLSKYGGNTSVAMYGAATNLTDKLMVIPNGIGASIFPAISVLHKESKIDEAVALFRNFSRYVVLCGLPIAVGTTALSTEIIALIYGPQYSDSAVILSILIWSLFFMFVRSVFGWTLSAIHHERANALVAIITTPIFILVCFYMAINHGANGVAISVVFNSFFGLLLIYFMLRKYLTKKVFPSFFIVRILFSVGLMFLVIMYMKTFNFIAAFFSAVVVYAFFVLILKLITIDEVRQFKSLLPKRKS